MFFFCFHMAKKKYENNINVKKKINQALKIIIFFTEKQFVNYSSVDYRSVNDLNYLPPLFCALKGQIILTSSSSLTLVTGVNTEWKINWRQSSPLACS